MDEIPRDWRGLQTRRISGLGFRFLVLIRATYLRQRDREARLLQSGGEQKLVRQIASAPWAAGAFGALAGATVSADLIAGFFYGRDQGLGLTLNLLIGLFSIILEVAATTRRQLQLIADTFILERVPLDPDDLLDLMVILALLTGGSAEKRLLESGPAVREDYFRRFVAENLKDEIYGGSQKIFRRLALRLLRRTLVRYALPVFSIALGFGLNFVSTRRMAAAAKRYASSSDGQPGGRSANSRKTGNL